MHFVSCYCVETLVIDAVECCHSGHGLVELQLVDVC
jgi:hypothetical protein